MSEPGGLGTIEDLVEASSELLGQVEEMYAQSEILAYLSGCDSYHLLCTTAVLTARNDGTHALGTKVDGRVIPAAPYLRDPAKHETPDEDYIKDWIHLANLQLLLSGACFGLDVDSLMYDLVEDTRLSERECSYDDDNATRAEERYADRFIRRRALDPEPDNPYRDRVILLFRWGSQDEPVLQACSNVTWPYILMPGQYGTRPLICDGKPVWGNNHLTHELGHFMGLAHTFPDLANRLTHEVRLDGRNPGFYPLVEENLPSMPGVTAQELAAAVARGLEEIAHWGYGLEADDTGHPRVGIPHEYAIGDTPVDLGRALPLLHGDTACEGDRQYTLTRYNSNDLLRFWDEDRKRVGWKIKPGVQPRTSEEKVSINDTVRRNAMSYWQCGPVEQRFSEDQVKRMHFVLHNLRSHMICRTIDLAPYHKPWKQYLRWKPFVPPWEPIINLLFPKVGELMRMTERWLPAYKPWRPEDLRGRLEELERMGMPVTPRPAGEVWLERATADRWHTLPVP
jgi:hypothetical protein